VSQIFFIISIVAYALIKMLEMVDNTRTLAELTDEIPMTDFKTLLQAFDQLLQPARFKDYGPNGLQVEGKRNIQKIVSGVTASRELIDAAIAAKADAVFVHHGLFWRGQDGRVVGWMKERLQRLLAHDINLYAYHLPLDAHPELGNNAQLGRVLGFKADAWCGDQNLVCVGQAQDGTSFENAEALAAHVTRQLGRSVTCIAPDIKPLRRIAWCSGGAQSYFESAIELGADAFITGEISEPQAHIAKETGVAFLACGHHATERYGAPAVASHVALALGLAHEFIDIDNPA
jgi:dinuclear metal center YbgI/SA1388 family protein